MPSDKTTTSPEPSKRQKGAEKTARIPIKVVPRDEPLPKPRWIRARATNTPVVNDLKDILRSHNLYTVCEEATSQPGRMFCSWYGNFYDYG